GGKGVRTARKRIETGRRARYGLAAPIGLRLPPAPSRPRTSVPPSAEWGGLAARRPRPCEARAPLSHERHEAITTGACATSATSSAACTFGIIPLWITPSATSDSI